MTREAMNYDVVIVGAGPAGLATAIRLKQRAQKANQELSVCVVEKGAEVGAHILSGAVLEPRGLAELFPNWQDLDIPLDTPVISDEFLLLTETKHYKLPTPAPMKNHGNFIISLGKLCRWLANQAESLGVEIYPGFAASEILYNTQNQVYGIATGHMGVDKDGQHTAQYQAGMELHAKQTVFAEGCRGSLTKQLFEHFNLRDGVDPQTYGIGIKELWEMDSSVYEVGKVVHTIGWPLKQKTYGGAFIYHLPNNKVSVGFVVGLDYENPYLSPFDEFQQFKTHPAIRPLFEKGRRLSYGSRALSEGGFQSIPKLTFAGGLIVGDAAGFLNVPKIKGTHTAMKSGITAADAVFESLTTTSQADSTPVEIHSYSEKLKQSWLWDELKEVRNIRPGFRKGLWFGLVNAAFESYILRGYSPWTLRNHHDHHSLKPAANCQPINYPKPDGKVSFDRLSSVFISNTNHEENQPCHLQLKKTELAIEHNYQHYASPETRYCPAGVYEIVDKDGKPALQINAQNCVHCKTCDIKDPLQNINWVPPEGGGGPNYSEM